MKKISSGYYIYKSYTIYEEKHPKLQGKYAIYNRENFISRGLSLKDCKLIINKILK